MNASLLIQVPCELGEGPVWYMSRNSLFWVDILGETIYEYLPENGQVNSWSIGHMVSLIIEQDRENMFLAVQGGLIAFNLETQEITWLAEIEKANRQNRTNDGGVDEAGNIWVGTMELNCLAGEGSLYVIDKNFKVTRKLSGLSIPNGLVFSPDKKHMYHIDTGPQKISSYSYDITTREITFEKTLLAFSIPNGGPDGMTMDEEGMLWIAEWGGYGVSRWNPATGKQLGRIEVPVPHVSACILGGENRKRLFITTARQHLSAENLQKYPDSGSVYVADL